MRKRTVFHLCPTHKHYGGGRRTAEIFCEGGFGNGQPCTGNYCSILPGSDFFSADTTDAIAATWAPNWQVNMPATTTERKIKMTITDNNANQAYANTDDMLSSFADAPEEITSAVQELANMLDSWEAGAVLNHEAQELADYLGLSIC